MTQLLVKDALFNFSAECIQTFDKLKSELTQAPIIIKPDWSLPFEVMCDASGYAVKAVLGIDKHFKPIHYASKTMNEAQENYTTTEKELLAVVFAFIEKAMKRYGVVHQFNYQIEKAMKRYRVVHQFSTAYYPQTNRQVKITNQAINHILEKTIRNNRKGWSYKLDDALWAFRTAFKTRLGTTPFRIIYDKACHLPINELDEMRLDAYESSISYKERTKRWHDKQIKALTNYERGDKVIFDKKKLGSS
ncbi:reverse transcriptase domain-containing protein [Tanacetum coccineum]